MWASPLEADCHPHSLLVVCPAAQSGNDCWPKDWADYCRRRPLDPATVLPMLMDTPATLLLAVQHWQQLRCAERSSGASQEALSKLVLTAAAPS